MLFSFVLVSWKIFLKMLPSVFRKAVICWISASKVIVCIHSAWDQKSNVDVHNHIPHSLPWMSYDMTDRDGVEMTTLNACWSFAILWHLLYMFCRICPSYHKHHPSYFHRRQRENKRKRTSLANSSIPCLIAISVSCLPFHKFMFHLCAPQCFWYHIMLLNKLSNFKR